jgi:hypothetical protein
LSDCKGHHAPDFTEGDCKTQDCHLDEGVAEIVYALWLAGVKTFSSCDGNHVGAINQRRVLFGWRDEDAGMPALAAALTADMPVYQLRKCYPGTTQEDYDSGRFYWELVFDRHQDWTRAEGRLERR